MGNSPLPFASAKNEFLRVDYLTTMGPRIVGLYANGVEGNLLAETPDVHWSTPHGEYYLHGGHRLWTAPEDPFYTCPENHVSVIAEKDKVVLRSAVDAAGLEKEIAIRLDENCIFLTHRVTWHGEVPIELAPWAITQLRLGGVAILPQSSSDGLLPNRNLVLWPYSKVNDERFVLQDDLILVYGHASEQPFKVGNYNSTGWIAYVLDYALFVKRFSTKNTRAYPDMGCNVEAYVKDTCIELETLGPFSNLNPKETVTYEESWEVTTDQYSVTMEDARIISRQLSLK